MGMSKITAFFTSLKALKHPSLCFIFLLNISSGIPMAFLTITLLAFLQDHRLSIEDIGLMGLVTQPYVFKVFWAPFIDRWTLPWLSRRRDWILLSQIGVIALILWLSQVSPHTHFLKFSLIAFGIALASSTQDIAINAYQTDLLLPEQRGLAATYSMVGYQVGMILAGAIALILTGWFSWKTVDLCVASFMGLGILSVYFAPQLPTADLSYRTLKDTLVLPFLNLLKRFSPKALLFLILFLILYKLSDAFAMSLSTPFLQILGFTKPEIGSVSKFFGLGAVIFGGFVGGYWMRKLPLYSALWVFGILQMGANIGFWLLALFGKHFALLVFAIALQNFCSGLGTAAFLALIMTLCAREFSATQFALMTAISALGRTYIQPIAGVLVTHIGWSWFFIFSILAGVPGLGALAWLKLSSRCFELGVRG